MSHTASPGPERGPLWVLVPFKSVLDFSIWGSRPGLLSHLKFQFSLTYCDHLILAGCSLRESPCASANHPLFASTLWLLFIVTARLQLSQTGQV